MPSNAVKQNLVLKELTPKQASIIYADEADILNIALFGITAKKWRNKNPDLKGNIRDYAFINELICLSNMENINILFFKDQVLYRKLRPYLNKVVIPTKKVIVHLKYCLLILENQFAVIMPSLSFWAETDHWEG